MPRSNSSRTTRPKRPGAGGKIQHTAAAAKVFFESPSRGAWEALLLSLSVIDAECLRTMKPTAPVEHYSIYESSTFTLCLFVLQQFSALPIHDHPGMTVLTKIVQGDLHVRTYEWEDAGKKEIIIDPTSQKEVKATRAKATTNRIVSSSSPDSTLIIHSDSGPCMHALSAVSDYVIIFDILGPPYNATDRVCSYFKEIAVQGPDSVSILPSKKSGLNLSAGEEICWLVGDSHADNESYEREYVGDPVSVDALRMLDYLPPMARLSSVEQQLSALASQKASSGASSAHCLPLVNESSANPTN